MEEKLETTLARLCNSLGITGNNSVLCTGVGYDFASIPSFKREDNYKIVEESKLEIPKEKYRATGKFFLYC